MQIKINTIITLSNHEKYMVLNETTFENTRYFLVMGMDESKEVIQSKVAIFKECFEEHDVYVEKIEDPKLIIQLTNMLKSQL